MSSSINTNPQTISQKVYVDLSLKQIDQLKNYAPRHGYEPSVVYSKQTYNSSISNSYKHKRQLQSYFEGTIMYSAS